jgi:hypothetical protein
MPARAFLALLCAVALNPFVASAWSVEGHQTVAIIAAKRLKSTTAARVSSLLGSLSLADIAICPDEVRNLEEHHTTMSAVCSEVFPDPPTGTALWHFINLPIKQPGFTPTASDFPAVCHNDNCVTARIPMFLVVLAASKPTDSAADKLKELQALSFVVHFIGDVHQPLHSADRNGDSGGNAEVVKFFSQIAKLHGIWDTQIVTRIDATPPSLASDLTQEITAAAAEPPGTQTDWAIQAYVFARDVSYKGIPAASGSHPVATLGQPYQNTASPVVRQQIARAGVRLANALNKALP